MTEFNTYPYAAASREEAMGRPPYNAGASEVASKRTADLIRDNEPQGPGEMHGEIRSTPQWLAIASCAAAIGTLVPITLYQSGVIGNLPEPPGSAFQADRLTKAPSARPFGIPDGYLGLASYGVTLGLLLSQRRTPVMNIARHAKLGLDGLVAGVNVGRQVKQGKYCSWCLGTAAATGAMLWFGYLAGKQRREARAA
jgi:hypothetical protein